MKPLYKKIALSGAALLCAAVLVVILSDGRATDLLVDDTRYSKEIAAAAARHGIPAELVRAVIFQESRFNPRARGKKGEYGLMQVLPSGAVADWARHHKKSVPGAAQLMDPELNLEIGCWYLGKALRRWQDYSDNIELALAQYNAGAARANKWKPETKTGKVLPQVTLPGTRKYITGIIRRYRSYLK